MVIPTPDDSGTLRHENLKDMAVGHFAVIVAQPAADRLEPYSRFGLSHILDDLARVGGRESQSRKLRKGAVKVTGSLTSSNCLKPARAPSSAV